MVRLFAKGDLWLTLETRHAVLRDFGHSLGWMGFVVFLAQFLTIIDSPRFMTIYLNFTYASTRITHFSALTI